MRRNVVKTTLIFLLFTATVMLSGCGSVASVYLHKPGVTTKTMSADYKNCEFQSKSLNQNNQIAKNIGEGFVKNMDNAKQYKEFMADCIQQKGYEYYNENYMKTVNNWDADFYKNSLGGFFTTEMSGVDVTEYVKKGNTYHGLGPDGKELKITEEYLRQRSKELNK